jgi:hypothetical protein
MAKLTISDAARACRVARSTLQRAINAGRLSLDANHQVDTAELLRAGYTLHAAPRDETRRTRHDALHDAAERSTPMRQDAAGAAPSEAALMKQTIAALERENALLRAALDAAAAREHEARENTQAAREERALLLQMLQEAQHRYDRLLAAPRPSPAPDAPPAFAPTSDAPVPPPPVVAGREAFPTRGAARQRILALLREYPEGLTAVEVRVLLRADRSLSDTCAGMRRDGLLRRVGRGRYVVSEGSS